MLTPKIALPTLLSCCLALGAAGCGAAQPATLPSTAPTSAPAPPGNPAPLGAAEARRAGLPVLRTGKIEPVVHAAVLEGRVTARYVGATAEVASVELDLPRELRLLGATASLESKAAGTYALVFVDRGGWGRVDRAVIWIRRSKEAAGSRIAGSLYTAAATELGESERGHQLRFRTPATSSTASDPQAEAKWAESLAAHLAEGPWLDRATGPWHRFAARRLLTAFARKKSQTPAPNAPDRATGANELARLMETTTGMTSLQETFQIHRPVLLAAAREPRTISIRTVRGPQLEAHPFPAMLARLGRRVPAEPLAKAVPAEFYYLRFRDLDTMFRLLDELDAWATPAARLLDGRNNERGLAKRYEAELGLGRGPITRMLGPEVVESLAVVGSDPYLREGSDLTVIFKVKSHGLFEGGIARSLGRHEQQHGALKRSTAPYGAVQIAMAHSGDGRVRQHRAQVGDLELVSNSPAAIRRVLDALGGKRPRLSDEPDFRYMLARDSAIPDDVLGFAGDRFVAEVIGPKQKILEARRQLALAELLTPGFAALLHGWVHGRSPATTAELTAARLLDPAELRHGDGSPITWQPGGRARSRWGSPDALTPLIDLPAPDRISKAEAEAYGVFARGYQNNWSTYVDPILLKLKQERRTGGAAAGGAQQQLTAHLRILPLIDASEYREIAELVGDARGSAPPVADGARAVLAIGRHARLRRELAGLLGDLVPMGRRFKFDWLGDWAMIGVADRPGLAHSVHRLESRNVPQRPATDREAEQERDDELAVLRRSPAYAAIDLRSTATATLALLAARKLAESAAPGMIRWGAFEDYRKIAIVQIAFSEQRRRRDGEDAAARDIEVYYAMCEGALLVALQADVLRQLIDAQLEGRGVRPATGDRHGQLLIDVAAKPRGALWTVLSWLLEDQARQGISRSRASAEVLLRGAPKIAADPAKLRALALASLGLLPLTPDGKAYQLAPEGVRDPVRGTAHAPQWPALPVAGSPAARLLDSVGRARSELSFDDEGKSPDGEPMRSLRVRLTLGLRH